MLSESSYLTDMYVYIGAALAIMVCLGWWLARAWSPAMATLGVLLAGALLLTPAYPDEGIDTLAPALVVAAFQWITAGLDSAAHALRPLGFMCFVALVLALLLRISLFRKRSKQRTAGAAQAAGKA